MIKIQLQIKLNPKKRQIKSLYNFFFVYMLRWIAYNYIDIFECVCESMNLFTCVLLLCYSCLFLILSELNMGGKCFLSRCNPRNTYCFLLIFFFFFSFFLLVFIVVVKASPCYQTCVFPGLTSN